MCSGVCAFCLRFLLIFLGGGHRSLVRCCTRLASHLTKSSIGDKDLVGDPNLACVLFQGLKKKTSSIVFGTLLQQTSKDQVKQTFPPCSSPFVCHCAARRAPRRCRRASAIASGSRAPPRPVGGWAGRSACSGSGANGAWIQHTDSVMKHREVTGEHGWMLG